VGKLETSGLIDYLNHTTLLYSVNIRTKTRLLRKAGEFTEFGKSWLRAMNKVRTWIIKYWEKVFIAKFEEAPRCEVKTIF
jgi:lysozyme family protein